MTRPVKHTFVLDDERSLSCAQANCGLPKGNSVHKAPQQQYVVLVTIYDLIGRETEVVGPFLDKAEAEGYEKSRKRGRPRDVIDLEIKPLIHPEGR